MPPRDQTLEVQKLFADHLPALRRFILSLLPNRSQADEVAREVFLTASTKATEVVRGYNFKAWVFAIARFKVLEHWRRAKRELHLEDGIVELESLRVGGDAAGTNDFHLAPRGRFTQARISKQTPDR